MIVVERVDGGLAACELGYGITEEGEVLDDLRAMINAAINNYFTADDPARPAVITLVRVYDGALFAA